MSSPPYVWLFYLRYPISPWPLIIKKHWKRICTRLASTFKEQNIHKYRRESATNLKIKQYTAVNRSSSRWNLWIFYFRSWLTLCKCIFSAFNQRSWQIRNWTIGCEAFVICLIWISQEWLQPINSTSHLQSFMWECNSTLAQPLSTPPTNKRSCKNTIN